MAPSTPTLPNIDSVDCAERLDQANSPEQRISFVRASPAEFTGRLHELVRIHLDAMGYPLSALASRCNLWAHNSREEDFRCVIALRHPTHLAPALVNPTHRPVGVGFTFRGTPRTWWYQQVFHGLLRAGYSPARTIECLDNYAELSEIHVSPDFQSKGIGGGIARILIETCPQPTIMLSTPEALDEANRAWRLYRRLGFRDLLRNFYFPDDERPFGILRFDREDQ